jgi:hypothetical protein
MNLKQIIFLITVKTPLVFHDLKSRGRCSNYRRGFSGSKGQQCTSCSANFCHYRLSTKRNLRPSGLLSGRLRGAPWVVGPLLPSSPAPSRQGGEPGRSACGWGIRPIIQVAGLGLAVRASGLPLQGSPSLPCLVTVLLHRSLCWRRGC